MVVMYLLMVKSGNVEMNDAVFVKRKQQLTERDVIVVNQMVVVAIGVTFQ